MPNDAMTKEGSMPDAQGPRSESDRHAIGHWSLVIHWVLVSGHRSFVALLALLVGVGACTFAPKYTKPPVAAPAAFKELSREQATNGWKLAQPMDDVVRGKWWEV